MPETVCTSQTAVILTALGLETKAVLRHLSNTTTESVSGTGFFRGQFEGWDVAVAETGAGNISAAVIASRACDYYKPKIALFVGVAGGVKDVAIGDVVVATKVYGYESGKEKSKGFLARPNLLTSSHELEQLARSMRQTEQWQKRLDPEIAHDNPTLHIGPIAAGEKVVANKRAPTAKLIQTQYGDTLAVEMEGRGFLEGIHINHPVQGCVIRGISDLLSGKANADQGGAQERAADAAAAVAFAMLSDLGAGTQSPQGYAARPTPRKVNTLEESDLRAMAESLLDAGKPPSMTRLFRNTPLVIRTALAAAGEIERTVREESPSIKGPIRTSIASLISKEDRRHLILGPPGSGKTHALWRVASELLEAGEVIPLLLPAGQVDRWNDLASMLRQAAPDLELDDVLRDPRVCVLIDGWSEFASGEHAGEKQKALRALQNTRIVANGKISDVSDTPFKTWVLELLTQQQVTEVITAAHPGEPLPQGLALDLLGLPLLLAIHVHLASAATATGELLRQFHDHLTRDFPEDFTAALAEAVAMSALSGNRAYGHLVAHLQSRASAKGIAEPVRMLRRLGTIVERNGQALPIHDLYWNWLCGLGLISGSVTAALDQLQTRESYRLALQSGARPKEADIEGAVCDDLVLAAMLNAGLRPSPVVPTLTTAIRGSLGDARLAVRNRGVLAALESGSSAYLKDALDTISALSSANLFVPDWLQALRPEVLFSQRAILADWIGSVGSKIALDAIAERGGPEWVPWLEQVAAGGKITNIAALAAALSCGASMPLWGRQYLDELFRTAPWTLRAAAARRCNHELARYIAINYERLVDTILPQNSGGWFHLNRTLASCGDVEAFEFLLGCFSSMTVHAQELLGYAVVDRGQPWISAFQRIAFGSPSGQQHHKLAEISSPQIEDETARAWINAGHYEIGWRVLIARHGAEVLPELIAELPASFAGVTNIPSLAVMRFLDHAPVSLVDELMKRLGSPMEPKVTQDMLNAMAKADVEGVPSIVQFVSGQLDSLPALYIAQALRLYQTWCDRDSVQLMIHLMTGESLNFSRWIARHSALHRWEDHFTPQMLSLLPELAVEVVLGHLKGDIEKCASVLSTLRDVISYSADLLDYMLAFPKLAVLIPSVFASAFDTFPVAALHRCIDAQDIDQETLLWRLGATSNPLHRSLHEELIRRVLTGPINFHRYRYVASMLRGHTTEDIDSLLRNVEGRGEDNWLWLVREVEAARGERLINETGKLRLK